MPEAELPDLTLAAEFPTPTEQEWAALVDGVLRKARRIPDDAPAGAGAEKLVRTGPDGIAVRPLYTGADVPGTGVPGQAPYVRGGTATRPGWDVRQRHDEPDADAARAAVTADLENGVTSIWLTGTTPADLPHVLGDVLLDLAPVVLEGEDQPALADAFLALPGDPADRLGTLGLDPIGVRARTGSGPAPESVVELAQRVAADFPMMRAIVVDALPVHSAGGSDAQELGFALAAGVEYLRVLTTAGLDVPAASRLCEFRLAATAEQFPTIAKLRAARRLWSRVTEACGSAEPMFQHAVASPTMLTRRDPYVNLLRGTLAGFAAGVGGADAVTVAPFDAAIGVSEPFSRRIARNTQALLMEESHLARVLDPAGGSWYVESLTDALARAAWAFFQEIEAAGGAVAALDSGLVAERTADVRSRREKAAATRKVAVTGVSEFPDLDERPVERRPRPAPPTGGLPVHRPAQPFEAFRDRSDARLAEAGARPRAFLATLGPLAAYTARAGFARNLLAAGGIEAVEAGPTETADEVRTAFADAGTTVAVLCSTDALYTERAAATVAALRDAGATRILLAGKGEFDGVDGQLFAGCDALAVIEGLYEEAVS
jgi:methylmalonyl-CoA mutase